MKKIVFVIAALWLGAGSANAQLTTRENCATNECFSTRPVKGDMALTFGLALTSDTVAGLDIRNSLNPGDLLTFKMFHSNSVAYRIGLRLYKDSQKYKGESDSALQAVGGVITPISGTSYVNKRERKVSFREYDIVPGIEKHYSPSNIFDVYAGADLYLGWRRNVDINDEEYKNGDQQKHKMTTSSVVIGLGGVVGFNVFISNLPISIGLEYGWNAKYTRGGKTKHEVDNKTGVVAVSETYYTANTDINTGGDGAYNKLKQSEFGMDTNQNVRLTLNIYFSRDKGANTASK